MTLLRACNLCKRATCFSFMITTKASKLQEDVSASKLQEDVSKPYLDPTTASKPYLAAWNPQQQALHTQWKSISNRIFILNGPLFELSICACAFVSALHVLLSFLSFISVHVLLYPHCNSLPLHVFTNLASKVTYKQHMLSNKLCCSVKIKNK